MFIHSICWKLQHDENLDRQDGEVAFLRIPWYFQQTDCIVNAFQVHFNY